VNKYSLALNQAPIKHEERLTSPHLQTWLGMPSERFTFIQKVGVSHPPSSNLQLKELMEGFILTCEVEGKTLATIKFYQGILKRFLWFLEAYDSPALTPMTIRNFLNYVRTAERRWGSGNSRAIKKASMVTVQRYYTGLLVFFNWCVMENYLEESPMKTLRKPRTPQTVIKAPDGEEINRLLDYLRSGSFNDLRNRAIILVALDTGLRLAELASLTVDDVKGEIITIVGKGQKQRLLRVGGRVRKELWQYTMARNQFHPKDTALWITSNGDALSTGGIGQMIRKIGKRLGIPLSPHKLRHSFATLFLKNGGDSLMLQRLLGHTTLMMTNRYCQAVGCYDAIEAHKRYSPVDNMRVR
jgi:site-specific recombinase XerD